MKNRRVVAWLLFATAVTIAIHVFLSWKVGVTASLVQRTTLLDSHFPHPNRIVVGQRGKPEADLQKDADAWRLVRPYRALADERAVMRLLDVLSVSAIDDTLGDQELLRLGRTREDFGLSDPDVRITVEADGSSREMYLGGFTPSGDGVYAAVSGEGAVYVVSSNVFAAANLPPEGFRRRAVFPGLGASVQSFDLKRGSGSFMRFTREGETWLMRQPSKAAANAAKVSAFLSAAASADAVDFVWPVGVEGESPSASVSLLAGYGLDPESAVTLTIRCADGADRQASFGKEAKNGLVYALVHGSGAIVTVNATLKDMALAGVSEFTDTRLFPIDAKSVSKVSVSDAGVNYLLAREDDGAWRLDAPVVAPTDQKSVSALLDRLFELKAADLDESGLLVSVVTSSAPVSVSREALLGKMRLEDLRSKDILTVEPASAKRIVVAKRGEKPTAVIYDRDRRAWNIESTPVPGSVSAKAVEDILDALNPLRAELIAKLKVSASDLRVFGLESPQFTIAVDVDREGSVRRNLLIGDSAQGGMYATLGATDAVFVLSYQTVHRLFAPLVVADDGIGGTFNSPTRERK